MKSVVVVPWSLSISDGAASPLGIVDGIREAVRAARDRHPALKSSPLTDISVATSGDRVRLALYFTVHTT